MGNEDVVKKLKNLLTVCHARESNEACWCDSFNCNECGWGFESQLQDRRYHVGEGSCKHDGICWKQSAPRTK